MKYTSVSTFVKMYGFYFVIKMTDTHTQGSYQYSIIAWRRIVQSPPSPNIIANGMNEATQKASSKVSRLRRHFAQWSLRRKKSSPSDSQSDKDVSN